MKRFILYLSILFIGLAQLANAQNLTVSLPDTIVTVGAKSLNIPLLVQNFNNIGAVSLKINYNPSVLKFNGITNAPVSGFTANADTVNGVIAIGWFSSDGKTPLNIGNGKLADLMFNFTSGSSPLNFVSAQSEISDINNVTKAVTYINGSVSSPIKVSLDNVKASPGDTVRVPLRGYNLTNVGSISLKIQYDATVLTFIGLQNDSVGFTSNAAGGILSLGWFSQNNVAYNLLNGVMSQLVFVYNNNSTPLTFFKIGDQTVITDINNNPLNVTYLGGSVSKDVSMSLPNLRSPKNLDIDFPLSVKNMSVGSASIKIQYDPTVLTFKSAADSSNGGTVSANAQSGILTIGYYNTNPTLLTGKLLHLVFTYTGGSSALTFIQNQTEVTDKFGSIYSGFTFNNGSIVQDSLPKFVPIAAQTVKEDSLLTFNLVASDGDDTTLTYSMSNQPTGATLTGNKFSWTPAMGQAGTYVVKFKVTDPVGGFDTMSVSITVIHVNRAPVFVNELPDTTISENQTLSFTYTATDPDSGTVLKFKLANAPAGAVIDSLTGVFTWTPNFNQAGTYQVVAVVSDGQLTDTSRTSIVIVKNTNRPPVFTQVLPDTTINENQNLTFTYKATDPDTADTLTYALVKGVTGAALGAKTGVFSWTPTYSQAGKYTIVVSVTDGMAVVNDTAVITVNNVPRAPYFTQALGDTTINGLDTLIYQFKAVDPDGGTLKYAVVAPTKNAVINPSTGLFRYIAVNPVHDSSDAIIVSVSNGNLTTYDTAKIKIITGIVIIGGLPTEYTLSQNYPNPFNPSTSIDFSIPKESQVVLKIYNLLGQEVATLVNKDMRAGNYTYQFNANNLSSGIYIYRLQAGDYSFTKKMTLLK